MTLENMEIEFLLDLVAQEAPGAIQDTIARILSDPDIERPELNLKSVASYLGIYARLDDMETGYLKHEIESAIADVRRKAT